MLQTFMYKSFFLKCYFFAEKQPQMLFLPVTVEKAGFVFHK